MKLVVEQCAEDGTADVLHLPPVAGAGASVHGGLAESVQRRCGPRLALLDKREHRAEEVVDVAKVFLFPAVVDDRPDLCNTVSRGQPAYENAEWKRKRQSPAVEITAGTPGGRGR